MITAEQVKNPILKDIITRKTAVSGKVYTDIGGATYIGNDEGGLSVIQTIGGEVIGDLKNSQVNKIGTFTREQILTGLAPVLDASKTVKGISKLSVAPDVKTNPIAVGDNDPRNSDARTPLAHASTHDAGGNDPITIPAALIQSVTNTASVQLLVSGAGQLTATVLPAGVDHNLLLNYVVNKHIDHSGVSIVTNAGSGLSGGGDITATRTLSVVPGDISHGALADLGADNHAQYHTDARALTWLGTRSTTDLSEGTNLYYTDARVTASTHAGRTDNPHSVTLAQVGGTTDHNALSNLAIGDAHTHYALLAGRAGGQTIIGGTGVNDPLKLRTTSGIGASGADIIFQVGNNGATEAMRILNNARIGFGTAAPIAKYDFAISLNSNDFIVGIPASSWYNFKIPSVNTFQINSNVGVLFQFTQTSTQLSAWLSAGTTIQLFPASAGAGNSNRDGMDFLVYAGQSTGNRPGGKLRLGVTPAGVSGTQANPVIEVITIDTDDNANVVIADGRNFVFNATTGTKIGTATTQKLALWNATPIVQPAANADTSGATLAALETEVNELKQLLRNIGAMAV